MQATARFGGDLRLSGDMMKELASGRLVYGSTRVPSGLGLEDLDQVPF